LERSPFHVKEGTKLLPSIQLLLRTFEQLDPHKRRQKAITAKFLKALFLSTAANDIGFNDTAPAASAELAIASWFFAMRGCEFTKSPRKGKTKPIRAMDVTFRDKRQKLLNHRSGKLHTAEFVTVTFCDQKNGRKIDSRSQRRTKHPILCPVLRWASVISRLLRQGYSLTHEVFHLRSPQGKHYLITTDYFKNILRTACKILGGKDRFGFSPHEIGSKSIRSGAAMAFFLADVSVAKIMILGWWASDAFLDYIRPQVLEWTSHMSRHMAASDDFTDLSTDMHPRLLSDLRTRSNSHSFNGLSFVIPKFNLSH
jgi:hypothetical protein